MGVFSIVFDSKSGDASPLPLNDEEYMSIHSKNRGGGGRGKGTSI